MRSRETVTGQGINFVANLRPQTIDAFADQKLQPSAYLLSVHRLTPATRAMALKQRQEGVPLFADNGSKEFIDQIIENNKERAIIIGDQVQEIRKKLGRTPHAEDFPAGLRRSANDLASDVVEESIRLSNARSSDDILDQQLSIQPTHVIAQEDFAVTCLVALGLERPLIGWGIRDFDTRNRRSLQLYSQVVADERCRNTKVYAVLSAVDYNTALSAGELAARSEVKHVAIGLASALKDPIVVESFHMGRRKVRLAEVAPRRYIRIAQIARGIADGYRKANVPLQSFHALGMGAASMFSVLAAAFEPDTDLTVDATSPIFDAVRDHVLYDHAQDGKRLSILWIVNQIATSKDWPFRCPFCRSFRKKFGHSARAARRWFKEQNISAVDQNLLDTAEPLARAIPLFSGLNTPTKRKAEITHIAHNHFVVDKFAEDFLDGPERRSRAFTRLEEMANNESVVISRGVRAAKEVLLFQGEA